MKTYRYFLFGVLSTFWSVSLLASDEQESEFLSPEWGEVAARHFAEHMSSDGNEEIRVNYDGSISRPLKYSAGAIRPPETYEGLSVFWNYARYDSSKSSDDWGYVGYSLIDRFHPEDNSQLRDGYVYLHAVMVNTNNFPVSVAVSAPSIDVAFNIKRLGWQSYWGKQWPNGVCEFSHLGDSMKNKIIHPHAAPKTSTRFFQFSLSDNQIGTEVMKDGGVVTLQPGQSVLVKWYAQEKTLPGNTRLLAKGILPKGGECIPQEFDIGQEFYRQCDNGKLNQYFFGFCSNTRDAEGRLVFNFHTVNRMTVVLHEGIAIDVGEVGKPSIEKDIRVQGMKTRHFSND